MLATLLASFTLLSPPLQASPAAAPIAPAARARIDYRVKPYVDMHFWVRDLAQRSATPPEVAGLDKALDAVRELDARLKSPLAWGAVEGALGDAATAKEARERFTHLPETLKLPGGELALRTSALALADALASLEPAFLEHVWPEHQRSIDAANAKLGELLTPQEPVALEFLTRKLGFTDDGSALPVCLVHRVPPPGAITHRDARGRGVCFVGVEGVAPSLLAETVLHELTHVFDVADRGDNALARLRKRLEERGVTNRDRLWRDVPHTLMFVNAGETVKRVLAPQHVHYGETEGYYAKLGALADAELAAWKAYLDGAKTLDQALGEIVAAAKPAAR